MKHELLKNKSDIINWLDEYGVDNYELIEDSEYGYTVNVNGDVRIVDQLIGVIGVKFNIVEGKFDCSNIGLTTLYWTLRQT